jgi:site-specific recombinase XerD
VIRPPRVPEQPVAVLTVDQVRALLHTTRGRGFLEVRDATILRLMIDTGIRRAELTGLGVDDVDLDMNVVIVFGKGRRERALPFGKKTAMAIPACPQPTPACPPTRAVACREGSTDQRRPRQGAPETR